LSEVLLCCFEHAGLSVEHADVVEEVGAVDLWKLLVNFEGLGVVVETKSELIEMSVAAAQVVAFLALLFELFSFELSAEVLDSFVVVLHAIVAISNVKTEILVLLDGSDSVLHAAFQLFLPLEEQLKGSVELPLVIQSQPQVEIVVQVVLEVSLGTRHCELVTVLRRTSRIYAG
jgi:hypothetical protein